jgi:CMP-N,N'-diacetyllegionaminic acid synthase
MRVLGVIPARGGSKGIPRKNLRLLGGKPLVAWTIEAARGSRLTRTVLSTDDPQIAEVGRRFGAEVPFLRPAELATDRANAIPVMQHALRAVEALSGDTYEALMMLQPTTPLRTAADINAALALLEETGADSVISVTDVGGHLPQRMKYLENGRLVDPPFNEEYENQPRQELRPMVIKNGAIYLVRRETLLEGSFKGKDCRGYLMPPERSANIDTPSDFRYAEWLIGERL